MLRRLVPAALAALALVPAARADEAPLVMIHSGYLLDGSDHPVTEAAQKMTFRLFDKSAPVTDEAKIWETTCTVNVSSGHYTVPLGGTDCGAGGLLPSHIPTDRARYLEVTVGTTVLLPRLLIGTVPNAAVASNALKLGGQALSDLDNRFAKLGAAAPQAGSISVSDTVSASKLSGTTLAVSGASSLGAVNAAGDVTTSGALSAASANLAGALTAASGNLSGALSAGSGTFSGALGAATLATTGDATVGGKLTATGGLSTSGITASGTVQAASFTGGGAGLTGLDASQLTTGTVPGARIGGTIANAVTLSNAQNRFTGAFAGDGSALTGLDASQLTTGSIPDARIGANFARLDGQNVFTGSTNYFGNDASRTQLQVTGELLAGDGPFVLASGPTSEKFYDAYNSAQSAYFHAPGAMVRKDSDKTTLDQAPATMALYNNSSTVGAWTKLSLAQREKSNGNPVSVAGLAAQTSSSAIGAWATGDLVMWTKAGALQNENLRVVGATGNVGIGTAAPQAKLDVNGGIRTRNLGQLKVSRLAAGSSTAQIAIDPTYMAAHVGETFMYSDEGPDLQDSFDCSANSAYRFVDAEVGWKGMYIVVIENATRLNVQWSGWQGFLYNGSGGLITSGMGRVNATLSYEGGFWKVQHMEGTVNQSNFDCW